MKQLLILLLLTGLFVARSFAQVSVNTDGTSPDSSAMLDVKSADKGLLIPRVALTGTLDETTVTSPATSLLIYNTATAGASPNNVIPSYYYWNDSTWVRLSVNAGGSGTTNYLPKWDSSGMLGNSQLFDNGTNVGIGRTNPSYKLDILNGALGNNTGDVVLWQRLLGTDGNNDGLKIFNRRITQGGTDWTSAEIRIQKELDGNDMHYISFKGKYIAPWGFSVLAIGYGNTDQMVFDQEKSNIGIGTSSPEESAALDITSTTKGFLPPRMTSIDRDAITSPSQGLVIYCTNCGTNGELEVYNGTAWKNMIGGNTTAGTLTIGMECLGGKLAYILQSGDPGYIAGQTHGLIAATSDQSSGAQWG